MTVVIAASYKHILILVYALEYKLFVNIKKKCKLFQQKCYNNLINT